MNRRELVLALSERLDVDRRTADAALTNVVEIITEQVAKGEPVSIPGFAKFVRKDTPAGLRRNNFTGEMVRRPASKKVRITPLKAFKDAAISGRVPKKVAAKKAVAKKAATARTTITRTTTARTATAKKAPAKAAAKKAAPARAATRKAPAKKAATTRAATATRTTAKKAPAARTTARKTASRAR